MENSTSGHGTQMIFQYLTFLIGTSLSMKCVMYGNEAEA